MATQIATAELPVIRAGGGILLRGSPGGDEVMIVFRARHQDWTLPKGKLKDGESFQEGALREVEEETGCRCALDDYLGMISYAHQGVPKVVMFWRMTVLEEKPRPDGDEITEALWLPVPAAIQCLTYAQEKSLLARMVPQRPVRSVASPDPQLESESESSISVVESAPSQEPAPLVPPSPASSPAIEPALALVPQPVPSPALEPTPEAAIPPVIRDCDAAASHPENKTGTLVSEVEPQPAALRRHKPSRRSRGRKALEHELDAFRVELVFLVHRGGNVNDSWSSAVQQHLENVAESLETNDLEGGWAALRAARRYAVLGLNPNELAARAQVLRDEALKIFSWRGPAMQRLLATADDKLTPERVSDAMRLRDEDIAEQLQRARVSTTRLGLLFVVCAAGALAFWLYSSVNSSSFGFFQNYLPLGLLGLLGSALAAAQQIMNHRDEGKIPGSVMLVAMVLAGAAAGLAAEVIYQYAAHYLKMKHAYDPTVYALAFILGYTAERSLSHFAGYSRENVSVHY